MARPFALPPYGAVPIVDFTEDLVGTLTTGGVSSATGPYWEKTSTGLKIGYTSALAAGTQGASARWFPPADLNLSATDFLYVEVDAPVECLSPYLQLFIGADPDATFTNYISSTSLAGGATKTHFDGAHMQRLNEYGRFGTAVASEKNVTAAIKKIEFRFRTNADTPEPQSVTIKRIWAVKCQSLLTVSYDNLFDTIYTTAFAGWAGIGVVGTLFMSGTDIGSANTMTPEQVDEMYAAGWDVGLQNYDDTLDVYVNKASTLTQSAGTATWSNSAGIPHRFRVGDVARISGAVQQGYNGAKTILTVPSDTQFTFAVDGATVSPATGAFITCQRPGFESPEQIAADVARSRAVAESYGWTRGNDTFAYSTGALDENAIQGMALAGINWARSANTGTTTNRRGFYPPANNYRARATLPIISMDNQTAAQVLANVDLAIAAGMSVCLSGHGVAAVADSLNMASAEFTTMIAGLKTRIANGLLEPATLSELTDKFLRGRVMS